MCVYDTLHTHQLILSLSVAVFGQYWSCFHWLILGPSREYYSPRKDTAYTVICFKAKIQPGI
jgi:hypothetical protein